MTERPRVVLPRDVMVNCWMFAKKTVVSGYGDGSKSTALSTHGAESNPLLQARARMAEVAFCVWAGLDAERELNWSPRTDQDGVDVVFRGLAIDIKQTKTTSRFLIWPANKARFLHKKAMDAFVLVRGDERDGFEMSGWISKTEFCAKRSVAPPNFKILEGDWFVDLDLLHHIGDLGKDRESAAAPFEHYCHCGAWGSFGVRVALLKGQEGKWFCRAHRPTMGATDGVERLSAQGAGGCAISSARGVSSPDSADADRSRQDALGRRDREQRARKKETRDLRSTGDLFG